MTSTLTLRTSNLKLPPSFVELDREEMSYVTGGAYISNTQIGDAAKGFMRGLAPATASIGGVMAALQLGWSAICSMWNAIPVVGQVVFVALTLIGLAAVGVLAAAYVQGKGVSIDLAWKWFIPYPSIAIR